MHTYKGFWYPDSDTKLKQVHDWVEDIDTILKHVDKFDVCIQAGGAVGVWPAKLAEHFKTVYTFEPVEENYECLLKNIPDNVIAENMGLYSSNCWLNVQRDSFEDGNSGAYYTKRQIACDEGDVFCMPIDEIDLSACDFIQLDVEGSEYDVLQGAVQTIERFKPVIAIEEKQLPHMKEPCTRAREFLESMGCRVVGRVHNDVVFKRC